MNVLDSGSRTLLQRLDDMINPIVVKELRQAVEGRFAAAMLFTFVLISLITMGIYLFGITEVNALSGHGRNAFLVLQGILVGTCLLFLPIYAALRLASERSDTNVDLLFITTIPPRAIVWGKLLATVILAVLVYAACLPFLTLTFLMRGVDLPSISLVLGMGFLAVLGSIQVAIFAACITTHRGFRSVLLLLLIGGLVTTFTITTQGTWAMIRYGLGSMAGSAGFWWGLITFVGIVVAGLAVIYSWSVALISPPSANRMFPVRLTMTIVWLITGGTAGAWAVIAREEEAIYAWGTGSVLLFAVGLLIAICERETLGPRVARAIPRGTLLRVLAFLFYSGAAGGATWAILMMVLSLVISQGAVSFWNPSHNDLDFFLYFNGSLICFAVAYCLTGLFLRRTLLGRVVQPVYTWTLALLVWALCMLLPPLFVFLLWEGPTRPNQDWMLASPIALANRHTLKMVPWVAGSWALVVMALNFPWYFRQLLRFQPRNRVS